MDALIDLSWRIYPATALVGLGAAFLYRGLRKGSASLKRGKKPEAPTWRPLCWGSA